VFNLFLSLMSGSGMAFKLAWFLSSPWFSGTGMESTDGLQPHFREPLLVVKVWSRFRLENCLEILCLGRVTSWPSHVRTGLPFRYNGSSTVREDFRMHGKLEVKTRLSLSRVLAPPIRCRCPGLVLNLMCLFKNLNRGRARYSYSLTFHLTP
jgi:hypothetical protein